MPKCMCQKSNFVLADIWDYNLSEMKYVYYAACIFYMAFSKNADHFRHSSLLF